MQEGKEGRKQWGGKSTFYTFLCLAFAFLVRCQSPEPKRKAFLENLFSNLFFFFWVRKFTLIFLDMFYFCIHFFVSLVFLAGKLANTFASFVFFPFLPQCESILVEHELL